MHSYSRSIHSCSRSIHIAILRELFQACARNCGDMVGSVCSCLALLLLESNLLYTMDALGVDKI